MKVSLNWIRDINNRYRSAAEPAPHGVDKLVERIGAQLGAVDEVLNLGERYEGILVVKVVNVQKHPDADKLTICLIDDGKAVKKVPRNKDGLVQIVCGGPNVKKGMMAVWIPPDVRVPSSYDKEPFIIDNREIRGITSHGMLASPSELAIGDSHEGLLVVEEKVKPGTPFAGVYKLDDYVIDIENKMFTHRPDLFGMLGVAREIAGIQQQMFKSPPWYRADVKMPAATRERLKLAVKNETPKLVPRFCIATMSDVVVKPSPIWLQTYLARVGARPINNIVDITNFIMLETAQPLHAYDYDKLKALDKSAAQASLKVRQAKEGEQLTLLGGEEIKLEKGSLVIATASQPIGLAGVKGGAGTEVDATTRNIVLECATFDMNSVRHSARTYGLFTDAATRFSKGQSPLQNMAVLAKTIEVIQQMAGGRLASKAVDQKTALVDKLQKPIAISQDFIDSRLGLVIPVSETKRLLENVEFQVGEKNGRLSVKPPFWRMDIEIPEDIVEEVGRLKGYDHLPLTLPPRDVSPAPLNSQLVFKSRLRNILTMAGANEALTYSFVNDSLLTKVGQDPAKTYRIRNALSPELKSYRLSLLPSLLEKIYPNLRAGFDQFALFELGKIHIKGLLDVEKLPKELERLGLVMASRENQKAAGAPFYEAKYILEFIFKRLGIRGVEYQLLSKADKLSTEWQIAAQPFEPERTALVMVGKSILGIVGEPSYQTRTTLKLPAYAAQAELDILALANFSVTTARYHPLSRYPSLAQDICLRSSINLSYAGLTDFIKQQLEAAAKEKGYIYQLESIDVFQRPGDLSHKQTTWRITLTHPARTLTTREANQLLDKIASAAKQKLRAERI